METKGSGGWGANRRGGVVVVGTDGSDTSLKAVEAAARLALTYGQRLVVATGFRKRRPERGCRDIAQVPPELRWQLSPGAVGEEIVGRAVDFAREVTGGQLDVRGRSEAGDPAKVLLGLTDELEAVSVVVGNVGMRHVGQRWSVPHRVARRAHCAVLMVDTQEWAQRGEAVEVPTQLKVRRCA